MTAQPARRDVLFSIKPFYVSKILDGQKTVELRRRVPQSIAGSMAIIYSTSPVRAIVGAAYIKKVVRLSLPKLWREHGSAACIAKSDFNAYFAGQGHGFAIMLEKVRELKSQMSAQDLETEFGIVPPQSYRYLDRECVDLFNDGRFQTSGRYKHSNSAGRPSAG